VNMPARIGVAPEPGRFTLDPALVLALLMSCGLVLRLWGVTHGFPDFVSGDERVVTKDAIRFINLATMQPLHFNYPALYSYVYSVALVRAYLIGLLPDIGGLRASVSFAHLFVPTQIALIGDRRPLCPAPGQLSAGQLHQQPLRAVLFAGCAAGALLPSVQERKTDRLCLLRVGAAV